MGAEPREGGGQESGAGRPLASAGSRPIGRRAHPIVVAGLLAGVLDICAAFAVNATRGVAAARVLQAIASGLLGPEAFSGGGGTAALGLLVHFVIASGAAATFYLASRRWSLLLRRPVIAGILYGVLVYAVMNHVVLPLSRVQLGEPPLSYTVTMIAIHMLFVGLPISLTIARMARGSAAGGQPSADRMSG